jgi:hypothetical protein
MNPNPSVEQLLQMLQNQHAALYTKMGTVTDPKMGQAILQESQEVLHRINLTQNLVFIAVAAKVTAAVGDVKTADEKLTNDLHSIAEITEFINRMSTYLGYVDKAIDIMKTIAAL